MKRTQLISQGSLNRILQAAEKAVVDRDFDLATELAERAQRLNPADPKLLLYLGQIHCRNNEPEKAWLAFERAARLASKPMQTLLDAGRCASQLSQYQLGHRCFEAAAMYPNPLPEVLAELAGILERLRRTDEAEALADRTLQSSPKCAEAILVRARLHRQKGELSQAEALLKTHLASMEKGVRVRAEYELGNILDRQGRFDEAMSAFQSAKSLLVPDAKRAAFELQGMRQRMTRLRESINSETMSRWMSTNQLGPPNRVALLGGHPRSGTTLLEQVLDAHAMVVSAEETQLFYDEAYKPLARHHADQDDIVRILESATAEQLRNSRNRYWQRMEKFLREPIGDRLLIDKNPSYTFLVGVFARIFPEAKYMIALRDPRDVCMSCFMQPVPLDQVSSAWLTVEGTVQEYVELMNMWLALRSLLDGKALEIRYEDMVQDLESAARKTLDFLGVSWDQRVLGFDEHARQKAVRSPTYSDVTKKVFKTAVGRWRNYQKYLEPHLATLEPLVKALGY